MNYRLLGNSGLRVSELALGTMTFGEDWGWGATKEEAQKVYNAFPVIPIIGARKLPQLQDNLASLQLSFTADQLKTLDEASRIDLGFPQEIFTRELTRGLRSGGMADRIMA
jgi:aryl-alcohol dehydrogenase-like predicted oxidoreductase